MRSSRVALSMLLAFIGATVVALLPAEMRHGIAVASCPDPGAQAAAPDFFDNGPVPGDELAEEQSLCPYGRHHNPQFAEDARDEEPREDTCDLFVEDEMDDQGAATADDPEDAMYLDDGWRELLTEDLADLMADDFVEEPAEEDLVDALIEEDGLGDEFGGGDCDCNEMIVDELAEDAPNDEMTEEDWAFEYVIEEEFAEDSADEMTEEHWAFEYVIEEELAEDSADDEMTEEHWAFDYVIEEEFAEDSADDEMTEEHWAFDYVIEEEFAEDSADDEMSEEDWALEYVIEEELAEDFADDEMAEEDWAFEEMLALIEAAADETADEGFVNWDDWAECDPFAKAPVVDLKSPVKTTAGPRMAAMHVESGLELFAKSPDELLNPADRKLLRTMETQWEELPATRHAALEQHVKGLGHQASALAARFQTLTGIETLWLSDDVPAVAAYLGVYRLVERGDISVDEGADLLRRTVTGMSAQWIEGVRCIIANAYEDQGIPATAARPAKTDSAAKAGRVIESFQALVWETANGVFGSMSGTADTLARTDWLALLTRPKAKRAADRINSQKPVQR